MGVFYMLKQLVELLNTDMREPLLYGSFKQSWFHYVSLILMVIGIIIVVKFMTHADQKKLRRFFWIAAWILIGFEIYKQWVFTYQSGAYPWYIFPFQFCSTPMYILLLAAAIKHEKIHHALLSFLATFGMFAGLAVMLYPATVFVSTVGINIQTMVHHGMMAIIGIGLSMRLIQSHTLRMTHAVIVFISLVSVAILLNTIHNTWIMAGTFNMFFINPLYENEIPLLSIFQPLVPHGVFLFIYVAGFSLVALVMHILSKLAYSSYIKMSTKENRHIIIKKRRATS